MDFIWKALILVACGMILLRISGRKSISQMTVAQTVVMISIGSIIIQPFVNKSVLKTLGVAGVYIVFLLILEYLQIKSNYIENIVTGKSKVVIEDGKLVTENLRKIRLTVDQLEMQLRSRGITDLSDVETATLEPNGRLGYELKRHAKPVTIGEMEKMLGYLIANQDKLPDNNFNIFDEVKEDGHKIPNPKNLQ